ncbi:hypothetical protein [Streptomyces sp. NPDC059918]|uniref:hypothetical protein n=1 Tax=unclassified Streptomyces TaxID=2593676 RepID=UPI00364D1C01
MGRPPGAVRAAGGPGAGGPRPGTAAAGRGGVRPRRGGARGHPLPARAGAGRGRGTGLRAAAYAAAPRGGRRRRPRLLGQVATESARLGQRRLRHPEFEALLTVSRRAGAVGVQIAHSGAVAGVLFEPAAPGLRHRVRGCLRALDAHGIPATRTFTTFTHAPTGSSKELPHGPAHRRGDRPTGPDTARRPARLPAL